MQLKQAKTQLKAYLDLQKFKRQKYPGSTLLRSVQSTLRLILRSLSSDSLQHQKVSKILEKMQILKSVTPCSELDEASNQMLSEARQFMRFMKFGFIELTSKVRQYTKYEDPYMVEYLVEAQNEMQFGNFFEGYERELLKKKQQHGWTEQFVQEWVKKAIEMKENKIELFQKKTPIQQVQTPSQDSFKRNSSTVSQSQETQADSEPKKKIKKESLSYYVFIMSGKTILKHMSSKKEKSNFQARLRLFRQSQDPSVFQTVPLETAKQLFELRSYFKNFMQAFIEVTTQQQYKSYDDRQMSNKVLQNHESIDPNNIFESYKKLVNEGKLFSQQWPEEMKKKIFDRTIEKKMAETRLIIERQQQQQQKR